MHAINFLLGDKITNLHFNEDLKPTTTLLQYLRSQPNYKGTKEGCGEGDCGACTVVIAELTKDNTLIYKAVNSCLVFMPCVNGKQIITIEHLGTFDNLHPIQKAIVAYNASQCGFCTPGVIMSAFELFKSGEEITMDLVDEALEGNLCRCTGYRSIRDAIFSIKDLSRKDKFTEKLEGTIKLLQQLNIQKSTLTFTTGRQHYFLTNTLKEALTLAETNPDSIKVNGSTDIALKVTKKRENLGLVIDFSNVQELKQIEETSEYFKIGAGLEIQKLKTFTLEKYPEIHKILDKFASKQIRNRATIGGNICSSSPIGDLIPILMAYQASIEISNTEEKRIEKLEDFITGYHQNTLATNEIMTNLLLPKSQRETIIKAYKISKRKKVDISTVSVAFTLKLRNEIVTDFKAYFGGLSAVVKRAANIEAFIIHKPWSESTVNEAKELLHHDFSPISDARSSASGRILIAQNLLTKFWVDSTNQESREDLKLGDLMEIE